MKKYFLIIFVFVSIKSQAAIKAYLKDNGGAFSGTLIIDNQEYKPAFWSSSFDLSEAMKSNAEAFSYAQQYEKYVSYAGYSILGGIVASNAYGYAYKDNNYTIESSLFWIGLVLYKYFSNKSESNFYKAIKSYNGDDSEQKTISLSFVDFNITSSTQALNLVVNFNF